MYAIFYLAGGIPRMVNTLSDFSLLYGFSCGKRTIEVGDLVEVVRGRRIGAVNKAAVRNADMDRAREFIRMSTGLDIEEAIGA